jgi:lysophospholipase L1-like esterase
MRRRLVYAILVAFLASAGIVSAGTASSAVAPVRIMPLGDSITGGPGCWRAMLWDRLQRTGFTDIDFVGTLPGGGCSVAHDGDNEGHGGFQATGIANQNQLPGWLSATRPDIVLMHLGTNDVWNNVPTATIIAAFDKLVDQMRASNPNMKIIVAQIVPMTPSGCTWCPPGVTALNNAIPGWVAGKRTAQSPITVVDQFTGFDTVADTTGDGVHPDDSGFQKMSDRWYPALTPLLGATPSPVDTTPPSVPSGLRGGITCSLTVTLNWTASTDNVAVTGYDVYRASGGGGTFALVGTTTTTSFTEQLGGASAQYQVRARDAAGNASAFTAPVTVLPPPCPTSPPPSSPPPSSPPPTGGCTAAYSVGSSWNGGFQGQVTVRNTGANATTSWTVTLAFPNGQRITQIWGARTSSTASPYTITNESYNGTLAPNATTTLGFLATWTGTNNAPTATCARTP